MKLRSLGVGATEDVALQALREGDLAGVPTMELVQVRPAGDGLVLLVSGEHRVVTRIAGSVSTRWVDNLGHAAPRLSAVVAHDGTDGVLRTWTFARRFDLRDRNVVVQLDEAVLRTIAARTGAAVSDETTRRWLADEFLLSDIGTGSTFAILRTDAQASSIDRSFAIVGATRELDVRATGRSLVGVRLAPRRQDVTLATVLLEAQLAFATELAPEDPDAPPFAALLGEDSYLRQWARYGEAEYETEAELGRGLGTATYVDVEPMPNGTWRFLLSGSSDLLRQVERGMGLNAQAATARPEGTRFSGQVEDVDRARRSIDLRPLDAQTMVPPTNGSLEYSIGGSTVSHRRRVEAARRLANGDVPLPELAAILEMRSARPRRVERRMTWDSPATRQLFGRSEPTDAQKRAIEIALNTPDVAVIQGPPGTGKTQVIAAIAARVAEEMGESGAMREVLLTSFQHDAVDNVASRTVVFGLPAIKETARDRGGSWLRAWRQDRLRHAADLFNQVEQGPLARRREWLVQRRSAYLLAPVADDSAADLLDDLSRDLAPHLSVRLDDQLRRTAARLRRAARGSEKDANLVAAIRGLRTSAAAHADDGPVNARRVMARLSRVEVPKNLDLSALERLTGGDPPSEGDLEALRACKEGLLDEFGRTRVKTLLPSRNDDVVRLLNDVIREVDEVLQLDGQGLASVLSRFVHDLETDSQSVENALAQYAAVVAATCQASAGLAARPEAVDDSVSFNTVIVDEAARANPLDLQIPLSIASRRVVLVGDQRQLPHIVDSAIANAVAAGDAERIELEESLFGRLFRFLRSEREAGAPDRVVTLNKQFRMHPTLGSFVSRSFYEPFGERIESPRPASDFAHALPGYEGRVASWLDVPRSAGTEEKVGTSRCRDCEAAKVADEAKRLMEAAPGLTFGIITFYRAQAELILEYLHHLGVADRDPDRGTLDITSDHWRFTTDTRGETVERLRVGTVDAFQGKEFDVALLSTVRTPRPEATSASSAFGHLQIMNRLCVAMSRQRRLLIAVGDRVGLTAHPLAEEHISPLVAFSGLCEEGV